MVLVSPGLVQGVEMQSRGAALQQLLAHAGDEIQAEGLDGGGVVQVALHLAAQPAGNLRAAGGPRSGTTWLKLEMGMMPGTMGRVTPSSAQSSMKLK
jgi:hypothetical protein